MTLRPLLHLLLLCGLNDRLITVVDGVVNYTGICDGGGLALTPDVYTQGYDVYKEATCVPDAAFCRSTTSNYCANSPGLSFSGDLNLTNMELLVYVGASAFNAFKGKLIISGSFPKWKEIREWGFRSAGTAESLVALDNATALEAVGENAFSKFKGSVTANGTYPDLGFNVCQILPGSGDVLAPGLALMPGLYNQGPAAYNDAVCIPDGAFCQSANYCPGSPGLNFTGDVVLENMEQLVYVGASAFRYFSGKVVIGGVFPKWKEIGESAFAFCGNSGSSVTLNGSKSGAANAALEKVQADAFFGFAGKVILSGSFPAWTEIGAYAFYDAGTPDSMVQVQCRGLTWSVGALAFAQFKGDHTNVQGEAYSCTLVPSSMSAGTVLVPVLVSFFFGLAGMQCYMYYLSQKQQANFSDTAPTYSSSEVSALLCKYYDSAQISDSLIDDDLLPG